MSEYHTGYRAFAGRCCKKSPLEKNSDDFVFDNQLLAQVHWFGAAIGELTYPAKYMREAASINFRRSVRYGFGCVGSWLRYRFHGGGWLRLWSEEPEL